MKDLLAQARETDEILIDDLQTAAVFCVYGQLGILLASDMAQEVKAKRIRQFLLFALRL